MHLQTTYVSHIMVPYKHNAPTLLGMLLIQVVPVSPPTLSTKDYKVNWLQCAPQSLWHDKGLGHITITSKAII